MLTEEREPWVLQPFLAYLSLPSANLVSCYPLTIRRGLWLTIAT